MEEQLEDIDWKKGTREVNLVNSCKRNAVIIGNTMLSYTKEEDTNG